MEVDNEQPRMDQGEPREDKMGGFERLLVWFNAQLDQIGVAPIISLSSLITAIVAVTVTIYNFEANDLLKQLSENRATSEAALSEMQSKLEERIPERVRSPLPIFPKNDVSLVLGSIQKETILELEWVDRDRKHRHQYLVQVVCIAEIRDSKRSENSKTQRDVKPRCSPHKLDADTPSDTKLDQETFHWTQPGVDTVEVPIKDTGTYAWRVARVDTDGKGNITIFEEWSPYFIFTVFESIESRVKVTGEVLVGIVEGSALQQRRANAIGDEKDRGGSDVASKEQTLVDSIQEKKFQNKPARYSSYPTYEALIEAVIRGEVDYAIGEITHTKDREDRGVYFTQGYHDASPWLISKSSRKHLDDGSAIGVLAGSATDQALTRQEELKRYTIVRESLPHDLINDLKKGTVDFIFTASASAKDLLNQRDKNGDAFVSIEDSRAEELKKSYKAMLGDSPMFAIATVDKRLCVELRELVTDGSKGGPVDGDKR